MMFGKAHVFENDKKKRARSVWMGGKGSSDLLLHLPIPTYIAFSVFEKKSKREKMFWKRGMGACERNHKGRSMHACMHPTQNSSLPFLLQQ